MVDSSVKRKLQLHLEAITRGQVSWTNHQLKEGEKLKLHPPILSNFATLIALEALMGATGQLLSTDDFTQLIHLSDWVPAEKPPCNDCSALIKVSAVQRHRVWWVGLPKNDEKGAGCGSQQDHTQPRRDYLHEVGCCHAFLPPLLFTIHPIGEIHFLLN